MKQLRIIIAALLIVATGTVLSGQQLRNVNGKVTSSNDGSPISDVQVRLKGSLTGTTTDENGLYRLSVDPRSSNILVFTHPGFDDLEIEIGGRNNIDVVMKSDVRFNQYGVPVERVPLLSEAREGVLVFESKDRDFKLWYDTRVQIDGSFLWGAKYNEIPKFGTEVRRARFAVKAELPGNWEAELDLDFADSRADLKDAYLKYSFGKRTWVRVGNYKERFSMETNTTSRYLPLMERPIGTRVLTPSRHLGLQAAHGVGPFIAVGGVHFQDVGGWEEVENRKTNYQNGFTEGYSLTGKFTAMPFYNDMNKGLHLAVAGSYRTPKSHVRAGMQNAVRFDSRSYPNVNRLKYLDTDRFVADHYTLANSELAGYYGPLRIQTEYTTASVTRPDELGVEKFKAFYVMSSVVLFGGKQRYNTLEGEFTQPSTGRPWGDIELAMRYEFLDLNSREGYMWGAGEGFTVGLNYYANTNVKLVVNYRYANHDRYATGRGALFVGRDINGELTKNPQQVADPQGKGGDSFSGLSFRFEVAF